MHKKSQVFTTDFLLAFFIFSVLVIITMMYWNNYNSKLEKSAEFNIINTEAFQISNALIKSKGSPEDWSQDNVKVIGLAESDRVLSEDKINLFVSMPINKTKEIFQMHNFNFLFILRKFNEDVILSYGYNKSSPLRSISVRRYVTYNNGDAIAEFNMWEER